MKKSYSIQSLVKATLLRTTGVILLSSASPVFAANFAITKYPILNIDSSHALFTQSSYDNIVFTNYYDHCGVDRVIGCKGNTLSSDKAIITGMITQKLKWTGDDLVSGNDNYFVMTDVVSDAMRDAYKIKREPVFWDEDARALRGAAVSVKSATVTWDESSVYIGLNATARSENSVALGMQASAVMASSIAIGFNALAIVEGGIALGEMSIARVGRGVLGYDPLTDVSTTDNNIVWRSTNGALSIGDIENGVTRQIIGVAAGSEDTDAVNVAQLKALRELAVKGWQLSVNGEDPTRVTIDDLVDFSAGSKNFIITRGDGNNKIQFDLAKDITLNSVKIGGNTLDATGLVMIDGPKMTIDGINAGNKEIEGIKAGELSQTSKQAVNGSQLFATDQNVAKIAENVSKYFGGSADILNGVAPTYTVMGETYKDVASAFAGVSDFLTDIENGGTVGNKLPNALLWSDTDEAFVALHGKGEAKSNSKLKYLLDGSIFEGSTEAITGNQLYLMSNKLAAYLGGSADILNGVAPTYTVMGETYRDVASAFAGVSNFLSDIENGGTVGNKLSNALLWSDTDEAFVALHGKGEAKSNSKLKYLLDGSIAAGSTEAVTGNQLYLMSNKLAAYLGGGAGYVDDQWISPKFEVVQLSNAGKSGEKNVYNTVSDAFDAVSDGLLSVNDRINDLESNIPSNGLTWDSDKGAYDASHNGTSSNITNVAKGEVNKGSTDAVNGEQLWETNQKVDSVAKKVDDIDQKIKDVENKVVDGAVTYDRNSDGTKTNTITLAGEKEGDPVVIDNVANGSVEIGSKQAVNGGQLKEKTDFVLSSAKEYTDNKVASIVKETQSYTDMKFDILNYGIKNARKEARQAAAIGLAVSNLRYNDTPGKLSIAFGSGIWRSQSAFAFGTGYTSEDGIIQSNISVTGSGGHWGIGAGFNMMLN
ncbi:YadA-like family protein [Bartonella sp. CB74]|uniref:YadA-like family protein n=1 Tax=Bartonella sp. CB74 TaxID=3113620 RepID=UPI002F9657AA